MKTNWKIALVCMTMLASIGCGNKNGGEGGSGAVEPPSGYINPINVRDNSIADWDALDQSKVAKATVPDDPRLPAIKELRVYSDRIYLNYMLVVDPAEYPNHNGHQDGMHIFFDVDYNDATGGFYDLFSDAAVDVMTEGPLYDEAGTPIPYHPNVEKWVGPTGGRPEDRITDNSPGEDPDAWKRSWSLVAKDIDGKSQIFDKDGDLIIEGSILIDYISGNFADEGFGIGFEIQQGWAPVGLLPQVNAIGNMGELIGRTNMLYVPFDLSDEEL